MYDIYFIMVDEYVLVCVPTIWLIWLLLDIKKKYNQDYIPTEGSTIVKSLSVHNRLERRNKIKISIFYDINATAQSKKTLHGKYMCLRLMHALTPYIVPTINFLEDFYQLWLCTFIILTKQNVAQAAAAKRNILLLLLLL